jgi:hypothetical protein
MSVHAGSILHIAGNNVIDRIQSAGLGDVNLPIETIREVGNELVVDKVPGEPDFTFSLETLDVSTDLMAWLTGKVGSSAAASPPGSADPAGTEYRWQDCQFVNIPSPWKDPTDDTTGTVIAGHLIPGYYPTRINYRFGVTDNASTTVELGGGSFVYGKFAPVENFATGDGTTTAYVSADNTIKYRKGGAAGTIFRNVFGVIVNGVLMVEGTDYTVTGGGGTPATITFAVPPANGANVRFCYFTNAAKAYAQATHASTVLAPGAVRGRDICVYVGSGGSRKKLAGVQSFELEATVDSEVEREFCNDDITGRSINGLDCTGTVGIRSKNSDAFFQTLADVTGVSQTEVFGWFNQNTIPVEIVINNPKTGAPVKTLYVADGIFQPPGTPARVNSPTDFSFRFDAQSGTFSEFKGAMP